MHQLALYVLDFDGQGRNESIAIGNASTHAALLNHAIKVTNVGDYVVFDVSGNVNVTIAGLGGPVPALSGIFLDPAGQTPTPTPTLAPVPTPTPPATGAALGTVMPMEIP